MATITSPRIESPSNNPRVASPSLASPPHSTTGTPSTSSLDLSRNDPQAVPPAATQRRNRAALRDYYNLKSKQTSQPASGNLSRTASIASTTSDSTVTSHLAANNLSDGGTSPLLAQLDDPSFHAQSFIANLLSTAPLRDILRTESALVSEIRNLDGERKALVYDNYSKLIKAVGTIGDMQRGMQKRSSGGDGGLDGVEALQENMAALEGMVRTLGPEDVDEEGRERRSRRKERQVVRWVLDAPDRIASMVEKGKREDAEMDFARVKRILDDWEGVRGVEEVRRQCQQAMSEATRKSEDG